MDTLIAGHRMQQGGPVSEAVVVQETEGGGITIEIASFDEQWKDRPEAQRDAMIARSLITLPASLVAQLAEMTKDRGYAPGAAEEGWTPWERNAGSNLVAANFVEKRAATS